MRNLKRALSLALASVMLLGMMVVGTSAASYPDVDENDNVEAIEVLNEIEVMIGDRGNFRPDAKVNRHEMAVIMAKLVLGNDVADNYVGSHPFTDTFPWADKYVAACYENDLISGRGGNLFAGNQPLTAVEAASMMLRALGYKDLNKSASDWRAPLVSMANQLRLFNGVTSSPNEELNRNQVAQLVLNTLKSSVVDLKDSTFTATDGNGQLIISGGNREYIVRSSREAYAYAINATESAGTSASSVSGATVELGEHLYNGKLRLNNDTIDDYGRPSRTWEYDGKAVGTYVKGELLRKDYKESVKGKDMYDLLGSSVVNDANYTMDVYVDGWKYTAASTGYGRFIRNNFTRNNETSLENTGRGVLTEVYVDSLAKEITVAIVNTYLAEANADYDTTRKVLSITVYDGSNTNKTLAVEDFPEIETVKDGDFMLINWADASSLAQNKVVTQTRGVEILSDKVVTQFSAGSGGDGTGKVTEVITDGTTYKSAKTLNFDTDTLDTYDDGRLTDKTYDIYLDQYGNAIGVDLHSGDDNYVFITGYDINSSNIANRTADAAAIFLDGTMRTIKVDVKETNAAVRAFNTGRIDTAYEWSSAYEDEKVNTWYTYTVDTASSTYTLKPIATQLVTPNNTAVTIKSDSVRLQGANRTLNPVLTGRTAYGNDDTVYLTVDTDTINSAANVIDEVTGTYTGVQNVDITSRALTGEGSVYAVYNSSLYIKGAVIIGEDNGSVQNYTYIFEGAKWERIISNDARANGGVTYYWGFDAVVEGEIKTLEVRTKYESVIKTITNKLATDGYTAGQKWANGYLFKLNYDSNGYVTGVKAYDDPTLTSNVFANNAGGWNTSISDQVVRYMNVGTSKTHPANSLSMTGQVLRTDGHTLYNSNQEQSSGDVGLALHPDCKFIVVQDENGKSNVKSTHSTIKAALARLANCNDGSISGSTKQFNGTISAVLDKSGRATWVVFDSNSGFLPDQNADIQGAGNVTTILNGSTADVSYTINNSGRLFATFDYKAPDFAAATKADGTTPNTVAVTVNAYTRNSRTGDYDIWAGQQVIDGVSHGGVNLSASGEAQLTWVSGLNEFDPEQDLEFRFASEALGAVVVKYVDTNNSSIDNMMTAHSTKIVDVGTMSATSVLKAAIDAGKYNTGVTGVSAVDGITGGTLDASTEFVAADSSEVEVYDAVGAVSGTKAVTVKFNVSGVTAKPVTYTIAKSGAFATDHSAIDGAVAQTGATAVALSNFGATGATDTLKIEWSAAAPVTSGTDVKFTATVAAAGVNQAISYDITVATSAGNITFTDVKAGTADKWITVTGNVTITDVTARVNTAKLAAITAADVSISADGQEITIQFNTGVCKTDASTVLDASCFTLTASTSGAAISRVDHIAGSDTVTVRVSTPLANGETLAIKNTILNAKATTDTATAKTITIGLTSGVYSISNVA